MRMYAIRTIPYSVMKTWTNDSTLEIASPKGNVKLAVKPIRAGSPRAGVLL